MKSFALAVTFIILQSSILVKGLSDKCPPIPAIDCINPPTIPRLCKDDSACTDPQICCNTECEGSRCMPVPQSPDGSSPSGSVSGGGAAEPDDPPLEDDPSQAGGETPGDTSDGDTGSDPSNDDTESSSSAPLKSGVCPPYNIYSKCMEPPPICSDDQECDKDQKCCRTSCAGNKCVSPYVDLGCPSYDPKRLCFVANKRNCSSNNDCTATNSAQICCQYECGGYRCMDPDPASDQSPSATVPLVRPGTCPPNGDFGSCLEECDNGDDTKCSDPLKCCSNGCGHTCQQPVTTPVQDPLPPAVDVSCPKPKPRKNCPRNKKVKTCTDDQCSAKGRKCCPTSCGNSRCQKPVIKEVPVRLGSCPVIPQMGIMCPMALPKNECTKDSDCKSNTALCCKNSTCGELVCIEPVKPGNCPVINMDCIRTPTPAEDMCSGDYGCSGSDKCCRGCPGYTLQCKAPAATP